MTKRYALFAGDDCDAGPGFESFISEFDSIVDAKVAGESRLVDVYDDWAHVADLLNAASFAVRAVSTGPAKSLGMWLKSWRLRLIQKSWLAVRPLTRRLGR